MSKEKLYFKYIHLLYGHDTKFSKPLLELIADPQNGFDVAQHLFVTPYKNVYDELKQYQNIILDDSGKNLYIKYYKHCQLMISHSGENIYRLLMTPSKVKKKIVYRYWGGLRISQNNNTQTLMQTIRMKLRIWMLKAAYSGFAAIGIANATDINDLSRILKKDTKYYKLSYVRNDDYSTVKSLKDAMGKHNQVRGKKKILLGHRGTEENNHIELIKKLNLYPSEMFDIYIPLSYGSEPYIHEVESYIKDNSKGNIIIIKEFMEFSQYARLLSEIDIAIFDGLTSYALGNIQLFLFFEKTIYLNNDGIIAETLKKEGTPYRKISDIGQISFSKFVAPTVYPDKFHSDLCIMSVEERIKNWQQMLKENS